MGRKKKEELPKVIFKPVPWTEEQREAAIKKLAAMWAHELGWVPKELNKEYIPTSGFHTTEE